MKVRLSEADAAALDLLLDRSPSASSKAAPVYASNTNISHERVAGAEKLLGLLQVMSTPEPSPDLLQRTLHRVGVTVDSNQAMVGAASLGSTGSQRHA